MQRGIDISMYQGAIDFDLVKSKVDFAFIRASFGAPDPGQKWEQYVDPKFPDNARGAQRAGIKRGYYHFAYPEYNSVDAEVGQFLGTVGTLLPGDMLALDYERHLANPVSWCKEWLDKVYQKTGVKPFIYLNLSTIHLCDWSEVSAIYPLWLAEWDNNPDTTAPTFIWPAGIVMRQYGLADFMYADGDVAYADLNQYGLQTAPDQPIGGGIPAQETSITIHRFAAFETNLQPSQTYSDEVKRMQEFLVWKDFMQDPGKNAGYYGPLTQTAVNAFQKAHGITGTSQFGWWYDKTRSAANFEL